MGPVSCDPIACYPNAEEQDQDQRSRERGGGGPGTTRLPSPNRKGLGTSAATRDRPGRLRCGVKRQSAGGPLGPRLACGGNRCFKLSKSPGNEPAQLPVIAIR